MSLESNQSCFQALIPQWLAQTWTAGDPAPTQIMFEKDEGDIHVLGGVVWYGWYDKVMTCHMYWSVSTLSHPVPQVSHIHVYTINIFLIPSTVNNLNHPSSVVFLCWTLPRICHRTYFHTSKSHVTWIIKKVNRIPTHCGVAYESVHSLARGHMIRVPQNITSPIHWKYMNWNCHLHMSLTIWEIHDDLWDMLRKMHCEFIRSQIQRQKSLWHMCIDLTFFPWYWAYLWCRWEPCYSILSTLELF